MDPVSTAETATPPRRTRPKDRRDLILREAYRLMASAGYNAVSLADIAKAAGIQGPSVLYHFGSMSGLLAEVLAMRDREDVAFYEQSARDGVPQNAAAARSRFTKLMLHNIERPEFVRIYAILAGESLHEEHPAHDYFTRRAPKALAEVSRSLAWKPDPELAAAELLAFWEGLENLAAHNPAIDIKAVWEQFCDRFFV